MEGIRAFLAELRRRHVFRVAAWYAVVSWLVIQVATQTFPSLQLPEWAPRLVIVLCLLGFPVALVLAWAYEFTPEGLRPTTPASTAEPTHHWHGPSLWFAVAGGVLLGVSAVHGWRAFVESAPGELGIAVMPFENLSPDPNDAYFADGVHEELLGRLAALHGVRVISRTSVVAYRGLNKSAPQIGRELDVTHVLEGSVRRAGERFRLTAQLIDAQADTHLWSQNYDGEVTDVFFAQQDVARRIVAALEHDLQPAEAAAIDAVPTRSAEAYSAYLKASDTLRQGSFGRADEFDPVVALLQEAVAHDPEFAAAHAGLASAYANWYRMTTTRPAALLESAVRHLAEANRLAPESSRTRVAQGDLYYNIRSYLAAEREYAAAHALAPGDPMALELLGSVARRLGRYEDALRWFMGALERDPRNERIAGTVAATRWFMDEPDEAIATLDRGLALMPDSRLLAYQRSRYAWMARGDPAQLRAILATDRATGLGVQDWGFDAFNDLMTSGDAVGALSLLAGYADDQLVDPLNPGAWSVGLMRALALRAKGDSAGARTAALAGLELLEDNARNAPQNPQTQLSLAVGLAFAGDTGRALATARGAIAESERLGDYMNITDSYWALSVVLAERGESEAALAGIREAIRRQYAVGDLRVMQHWYPRLRGDPRFQALLVSAAG